MPETAEYLRLVAGRARAGFAGKNPDGEIGFSLYLAGHSRGSSEEFAQEREEGVVTACKNANSGADRKRA